MLKYTKKIVSLVFLLSLVLAFSGQGYAESSFIWDTPSSVSQGRAFIVTMKSDNPFSGALQWRKKNIPFQSVLKNESALQSAQGSDLPQKESVSPVIRRLGQEKNGQSPRNIQSISQQKVYPYEAQVLLAMPHDQVNDVPLMLHVEERVGNSIEYVKKNALIEPLAVKWVTHNLTVEPKYVTPPANVLERIEKERQRRAPLFGRFHAVPTWELPFYRPVKGTISGSFAARRVFNNVPKSPHLGTDLRGPVGTPIYSLADGVVVLAEDHYYSGNVIYIDHGQGVLSMYGHLSAFDVKKGDIVKKGELIGKVGMTGRVTGPHLHLSLYVQGVAVDVMPFMENELVNGKLVVVGGPTPEQPRSAK